MADDVVTLFVSPTVRLQAQLRQWTDPHSGASLLQATFTAAPEHTKHLAALGQMLVGRLREDREPYEPRRFVPPLSGAEASALLGLTCWPTNCACVPSCELPELDETPRGVGGVCRG